MSDKAKTRYNDSELAEFRAIIENKIVKAEEDLALLREQFANDMNNEISSACYFADTSLKICSCENKNYIN